MKTTIKLNLARAIVVQPTPAGVRVDLTIGGVVMAGDIITPDQAGALIFGIEQALEQAQIAQARAGAAS